MKDYLDRLSKLNQLDDFYTLARDLEKYLSANTSKKSTASTAGKEHYELWTAKSLDGRDVSIRPINTDVFLLDKGLTDGWKFVRSTLPKLHNPKSISATEKSLLDNHLLEKTLYSVYQLIGCGMDLLVADANQARKQFGTKFEDLIHLLLREVGVVAGSTTYKRDIKTSSGEKLEFSYQIDLVSRRKGALKTLGDHLDPQELLGSIKTSSKDRMQKIFVDKTLLERVSGVKGIKFVGIFHNDIQRSGATGVSVTFVPKLFLIYGELLTRVDGVYYLDPPPHISKKKYQGKLKWFSEFLRTDLWKLV